MELFDEIIQNKQLEDNNRETGSSSKKEHRNIGKMFVYTVDALVHNAEEAKRKNQLRSADPVMFLQ